MVGYDAHASTAPQMGAGCMWLLLIGWGWAADPPMGAGCLWGCSSSYGDGLLKKLLLRHNQAACAAAAPSIGVGCSCGCSSDVGGPLFWLLLLGQRQATHGAVAPQIGIGCVRVLLLRLEQVACRGAAHVVVLPWVKGFCWPEGSVLQNS